MKPSTPRRATLAAAALLMLAACTDDPTRMTTPDRPAEQVETQPTSDGPTSEFPTVRRLDVRLTANGAFRPGVPIHFSATARANLRAEDVRYELLLLDGGEVRPRPLASWRGSLNRGASRRLEGTVTFPQPGYYRVIAQAVGTRPEDEPARVLGDSLVQNGASETLYLLVDESGGRLTRGPEAGVRTQNRMPRAGGYGPFVDVSRRRRGNRAPDDVRTMDGVSVFNGRAQYYNEDIWNNDGVPGAQVQVNCLDMNYMPWYSYNGTTTSDGSFSIYCEYPIFDAYIVLSGTHSVVNGREGAFIGTYFNEYSSPNVQVANGPAAHVFRTLEARIPQVFAKFGRSRGRITAWVDATDTGYGIHYCPTTAFATCTANDVIRTNGSRVFREDGLFVTVHEYGHGYHYYAVEPWGSYSCTDNSHGFWETENMSCAFVEGFANLLSMWVNGDALMNDPYGGDDAMESNPSRSLGDGVRIEATVAAFLYDLVDSGNEQDSPSNTVDGDDWFDGVALGGNFIVNLMHYCRLSFSWYSTITRMDGTDQLVYCLEGDASARTESQRWTTSWRPYTSVSYETSIYWPYGWSKATVRRLWKYNFYNTLEF